MAVGKGIVRNSTIRAVVAGVCDTSHGEDRVHIGSCGSAGVMPRCVLATVRGDDIMAAGETQTLDMLDEALERFFVLQQMPRIGSLEVGGTSEGQFTKRTVSPSLEGLYGMADNSHGEEVVRCCFLD